MEPRGKAFCISHSSWMLYLTLDQSSLYHLSLPRGTRVCRLVQLPWAWFVNCTPFLRGTGLEGWGWWIWDNDDNSNSLESLFSITWLLYSSWSAAWRLHAHKMTSFISSLSRAGDARCDPGVSAGHVSVLRCYSCAGGFIPRCHLLRLHSLPTSWPCTLILIIRKRVRAEEAEARKSRSAGCDLWAAFFFLRNQRNVTWFQLTKKKKVLVLFDFTPPSLYPSFLGPCVLYGKSELNSRFDFWLGNMM